MRSLRDPFTFENRRKLVDGQQRGTRQDSPRISCLQRQKRIFLEHWETETVSNDQITRDNPGDTRTRPRRIRLLETTPTAVKGAPLTLIFEKIFLRLPVVHQGEEGSKEGGEKDAGEEAGEDVEEGTEGAEGNTGEDTGGTLKGKPRRTLKGALGKKPRRMSKGALRRAPRGTPGRRTLKGKLKRTLMRKPRRTSKGALRKAPRGTPGRRSKGKLEKRLRRTSRGTPGKTPGKTPKEETKKTGKAVKTLKGISFLAKRIL